MANAVGRVVSKAFAPLWNWASRRYTAALDVKLRSYGLRYDDLYDEMYDLDIKEALSRLPQSEVDARNQRLKRALDLSLKHTHLSKEMQELQTPFKPYLQDMLKLVKAERKERALLGADMPYSRTIP